MRSRERSWTEIRALRRPRKRRLRSGWRDLEAFLPAAIPERMLELRRPMRERWRGMATDRRRTTGERRRQAGGRTVASKNSEMRTRNLSMFWGHDGGHQKRGGKFLSCCRDSTGENESSRSRILLSTRTLMINRATDHRGLDKSMLILSPGGKMARRVGKVALVIVILSVLGTSLPYGALAQSKAPVSVGELLKSIGLAKPALSRAPDFNLRDAGGGTSSLTAHRGSLVLLNFWATWCGPCREEMPSMDQLSRNFGGQGLVVVAVNQRESAAQVSKFMKTNRLSFSTPLDTDGRVAASYRVFGIPATYLIDGSGQPIGTKYGE